MKVGYVLLMAMGSG